MGRHIFSESYDQQLSAFFESIFFQTEVCPALLTAEWLPLTQIVVVDLGRKFQLEMQTVLSDKAVWRYQSQFICKKFLWNTACSSGNAFSVPIVWADRGWVVFLYLFRVVSLSLMTVSPGHFDIRNFSLDFWHLPCLHLKLSHCSYFCVSGLCTITASLAPFHVRSSHSSPNSAEWSLCIYM